MPGQLKKLQPTATTSAAGARPCLARSTDELSSKRNQEACAEVATVIDRANERALQSPDRDGFFVTVHGVDIGCSIEKLDMAGMVA
jgi:hypothetical protein